MKYPAGEKRVLVVGAGGHGQVVAEIFAAMEGVNLLGYLDDEISTVGKKISGIPVLGRVSDRAEFPHDALIIAIGDNRNRARIFLQLLEDGEIFLTALHPWTAIASSAIIGKGSMVCAGSIVSAHATIGSNVILNHGCSVDHQDVIGDHVHIGPGVHLGGEVTVGEGTLIGIGATVMPGRSIGEWSVVGAGAVVTKDVPDGVIVAGVPARIMEKTKDL